jgi:hypothetical protein
MYDAGSSRSHLAKDMNVGHHVVSPFLFFDSGLIHLFLVQCLHLMSARRLTFRKANEVGLHLFDSFVRDIQAELLLSRCQGQPQLPPCAKAVLLEA